MYLSADLIQHGLQVICFSKARKELGSSTILRWENLWATIRGVGDLQRSAPSRTRLLIQFFDFLIAEVFLHEIYRAAKIASLNQTGIQNKNKNELPFREDQSLNGVRDS